MLWSIESCQNRVLADQYHLTVLRAQVSTHRGRVFFEIFRRQVTSFEKIAGSSLVFKISYEICCFYVTMAQHYYILKFSQRRPFLTTVTGWSRSTSNIYALIGQNLTGEFMWKNLCSILRLVYFDSWWSWQSFVSTCDVFSCLSPLYVQNEIQLLSRVFCYSWPVCLLGFWLTNSKNSGERSEPSGGLGRGKGGGAWRHAFDRAQTGRAE